MTYTKHHSTVIRNAFGKIKKEKLIIELKQNGIFLDGYIENKKKAIMIDTGADRSFINSKCIPKDIKQINIPFQSIKLANGKKIVTHKKILTDIFIKEHNKNTKAKLLILEKLTNDIILGMDWLQINDISIH